MDKDERALFDGVDTSIAGLAKLAGARPPRDLVDGLNIIAASVQSAQKKFDSESDGAALTPLLDGLRTRPRPAQSAPSMPIDEAARFEIEFRLRQKEREFQQATIVASGMRVEALADDGVVVPGQPVKVTVIIANHGTAEVTVKQVRFDGFEGDAVCTLTAPVAGGAGGGGGAGAAGGAGAGAAARRRLRSISSLKNGQVGRCDPTLEDSRRCARHRAVLASPRRRRPVCLRCGRAVRVAVPPDAFLRAGDAGVSRRRGNEEVIHGLPVQYRYEGNIFSGEKRMDLLVVAGVFGGRLSRHRDDSGGRGACGAHGSRGAAGGRRAEMRVTVVNDSQGAAESAVKLELPQGWTPSPAEQTVKFTRQDESQTVRFQVGRPPNTAPGEFHVRARVTSMQARSARRSIAVSR